MGISFLALKSEFFEADLVAIPFFAFGLMGAFVAVHRPRNPVGWLFVVVGFFQRAHFGRHPEARSRFPDLTSF